ncbi:MAG: hypothetical protein H0U75_07870 [Legionella sp.]|nr:hypothetical protein [Legionella sp.]
MDFFSVLLKSLKSVFELEAFRHDKYVFAPIQTLKNALERFDPEDPKSYASLLKALVASRPFIEKWRLSFDEIMLCMDEIAKSLGLPSNDWDVILKSQKHHHRFKFSPNTDEAFLPWLKSQGIHGFLEKTFDEQTKILLEFVENCGFSKKFTDYLKKKPTFLSDLLFSSDQNFIKISASRLNLYLTDSQLATAILFHAPKLLMEDGKYFIQKDKFMSKFNEILSNGRSVSTLLRCETAKEVLEASERFKHYQQNEDRVQGIIDLPDSKAALP